MEKLFHHRKWIIVGGDQTGGENSGIKESPVDITVDLEQVSATHLD